MKCYRCGTDIIWDSTFMGSDIGAVPESKSCTEDDFEVYTGHCLYCGLSYEIADTPESERCDYEYFKTK